MTEEVKNPIVTMEIADYGTIKVELYPDVAPNTVTNFVNLVQGNYYAAGTGLLFCFTYLFVAFSKILKLSPIPFAWFSTFVAVNAVIFGTVEGIFGSEALGIAADWRWAAIWYLWAILWGTAFVEDICGKKLGKFVPILQIFEGIGTAWVPAVLMLLGMW